ncbi:MAG: DUF1028 domain-containing protein [Gammaproteobacteria bacterium]|nr:DUF1028 domain-containing protein [Gammaproteobacteria bacterium]
MTFSIVGRCERTRMLGIAITTSSICVGARCPWVRAHVGAVATQNITHPGLGNRILDLLEAGNQPQAALDMVVQEHEHIAYRQLTVVDVRGRTAAYTGAETLGINAQQPGRDCVAAGNLLSGAHLPPAMVSEFEAAPHKHLAQRLLDALQAGVDSGGEQSAVQSAALLVAHEQAFPLVDLRVDRDVSDPVRSLHELWCAYEPQMQDYLMRAIDPGKAPSYGVPGDP